MGIGVWGPSLDEKGNSVAGADFLERLADELELRSI
jgi:glutaminase